MDASPETESVTVWLEQLKAGDPAAAKPLWDKCFARLVALARRHLRAAPRASADEEDVALSAFDSFCRGCEGGRFPKMDDRDDLWRVLFVITARKATRVVRREGREKRGGGRVVPASVVDETGGPGADVMGGAVGSEPSPAFAAEVAEECRHLLSLLDDAELRQLAIWKMEGYTNAEIAALWDRSIPTVARKLARIRVLWERER